MAGLLQKPDNPVNIKPEYPACRRLQRADSRAGIYTHPLLPQHFEFFLSDAPATLPTPNRLDLEFYPIKVADLRRIEGGAHPQQLHRAKSSLLLSSLVIRFLGSLEDL